MANQLELHTTQGRDSVSGCQFTEWLKRFLTEAEASRLSSITVQVSPAKSICLVRLLEAWRLHVTRLEEELNLSDSVRTVWGVFDLVAALSLRSFIAQGMRDPRFNHSEGLIRALRDVDSCLVSFTEIDQSETMRRLDGRLRPSDEWWWNRIPLAGPIRREIERM